MWAANFDMPHFNLIKLSFSNFVMMSIPSAEDKQTMLFVLWAVWYALTNHKLDFWNTLASNHIWPLIGAAWIESKINEAKLILYEIMHMHQLIFGENNANADVAQFSSFPLPHSIVLLRYDHGNQWKFFFVVMVVYVKCSLNHKKRVEVSQITRQ